MANTLTTLADGQLPVAKGTLYTVPASTTALVRVTLSATGASNRSVNLYVKRSGSTSRRIIPKDMTMEPSDTAYIGSDERPLGLSAGDLIEGDASAANEVDYLIEGILTA